MKRLRIAFVVDRFGNRWGGAEAYGVALMREISQQHDVTVFARDYDPDCGVGLDYTPLKTSHLWPSWLRVLLHAIQVRRLTRTGYDIVHSHSNGWAGDIEVVHVTPVRYNWRVRPLPLLKRLGSYFSLRVQTYLRLEARRVAPRPAHHTVAVSALIAQQLHEAYGRPLASTIIPPGVSVPGPDQTDCRALMRTQLGYGPNDYVCILVARNPLRKGLSAAMRAFVQLPSQYKLLVVGSTPATDRAVLHQPEFSRLSERLILIPATSDVGPYYRAADACIHPTLNDSFGMAPLEAMSFGLPVVVSAAPWCGFAGYLKDGDDALLLADPEDEQKLAQAVQRIASNDGLRLQLQQGGERVVQRHAWPAIAEQYLGLYADILAYRRDTALRRRS